MEGTETMCQFCHQHGEGKTWYLKADHYSNQLLADLERRRYMIDFVRDVGNGQFSSFERDFQRAMRAPKWLRQIIYKYYEAQFRRDHFGQVVPIEDLKTVLSLANSIFRLPCICRKNTTGKNNAEYCIGLGLDPDKLLDLRDAFFETFRPGPDANPFERLTQPEALELHRAFEKEGLIHTLWTFKTPFIGAICNCDRADCLAMVSYRYHFQMFFRSEYVARVSHDNCIGCRTCLSLCQFGAMGYSVTNRKAVIDPLRCYGCGVCRSACEQDAISLMPRSEHPIARKLW
jgi:ferredoxin